MAATPPFAPAPLALTMGDPAGIGPDIALGAWLRRDSDRLPPFFVIGDPDALAARARALGLTAPVTAVRDAGETASTFRAALPVLAVPLPAPVRAGAPDAAAGATVIGIIERGVDLVRQGAASALVTNPVGKAALYRAGFDKPGHTEFLAELSRPWGLVPHPVMMLASPQLKVVPATVHIPLKDVPRRLSSDLIVRVARTAIAALTDDFGIAVPRIAVAGLNPHAGEDGALGDEDKTIVAPAVERLRAAGARVTGPHPADALFSARARENYDAAVAMYHDQALIPIKTLDFDRAVNVTLGLPFVRTSPDHGTAYPLAGTGGADPSSLIEALKLAAEIAARRRARA